MIIVPCHSLEGCRTGISDDELKSRAARNNLKLIYSMWSKASEILYGDREAVMIQTFSVGHLGGYQTQCELCCLLGGLLFR